MIPRLALACLVVVVALLAGACAPSAADEAAEEACVFLRANIGELLSADVTLGDRQKIADDFERLARRSRTRRFADSAVVIADGLRDGTEQRRFDNAVDRAAEVCGVPVPDYPARGS